MWITVSKFSFSMLTSAPAAKSRETVSSLPADTAHIRGVYPDYTGKRRMETNFILRVYLNRWNGKEVSH